MTNKKFKEYQHSDGTYLTDAGKYALKKFFHMKKDPTEEQCNAAALFLDCMLDAGEAIKNNKECSNL